MPILRRLTGTKMSRPPSNTVVPSMVMVPSLGCSSPATQRSVVVLPQPDGPSSVKNEPFSTLKLACRMPPPAAPLPPKILVRDWTESISGRNQRVAEPARDPKGDRRDRGHQGGPDQPEGGELGRLSVDPEIVELHRYHARVG